MDRVADWALGLSALGWAVAGVVELQATSPVGLTVTVLNLVVGVLFLRRRRATRMVPIGENAICLGSVVSSLLAVSVAPPHEQWPLWPALLFTVAGVAAVFSLLDLGRSFGVLPAHRGLVQRGPYRLVRHPVYLAELTMVLACGLAGLRPLALGVVVLATLLVVVRIRIEERLLATMPGYYGYRHQVPWRLLPGLW
ncbi:MAG: hypothetical protein JRI68_19725 [Deltaproteobacteria bacterium]|nr:hypothetical protein [Deltaproteobacteria bacterium]